MVMKKKLSFKGLISVAFFCMLFLGFVGTVWAQGGVAGMDCSSGVCFPTNANDVNLSTSTVQEILLSVLSWITSMFVILAVIIFVVCGMKYLFAVGDDQAAEDAKRCMKWAIVGVIVAGGALVIIRLITTLLWGAAGSTIDAIFVS